MNSNVNSIGMVMMNTQSPDSQDGAANGTKRKADDGSHQPRAKRNRYISIACNECKRRKIKCNGQSPCARCGNLSLECVYAPNCCNGFKDSQEYKEMSTAISALQDQVGALSNEIYHLRAHLASVVPMPQTAIDPNLQATYSSNRPSYPGHQASPGAPVVSMSSPTLARSKSQSQSSKSTFRGPTSVDFNFGVARSSLKTMGITSQTDTGPEGSGGAGTETREPSPTGSPPNQWVQTFHADKDPIWTVPQEEALRLCRVYEDEMGLMYPVLNIENMIAYAKQLYAFMDAARRSGLMQGSFPGTDALDDERTSILKLVLATALMAEAAGRSETGNRMFERVAPAIHNLMLGNVNVLGVRMLAMAAMYEFHRDRESTSWRLIGIAARSCIELGLHRRETYDAMPDETERLETILLFWSVYCLDRRWAFGTGMPFALQDADIDPSTPKPENRSPYLNAMIEYSTIGAQVWQSVVATSATGNSPIDAEKMGYLDYQIIQWHNKVPSHLHFDLSKMGRVATPAGQPQTRAGRRLPFVLYLRRNQMRMSIYRPVLHTATSIIQYRDQAHRVVDIAKDTIRVLTHIKETSNLYDTQQMLFNAFLTSSLAVLFLAVAHTPALFAENVRVEYYMGIELVRGFSKDSYIGKRLWKTVRILIDVAPKLGLTTKDREKDRRRSQQLDPSRSAAVAMAGLAGHNVDETALYQVSSNEWFGETGESTSPDALANDLSSLFEAAGGYQPTSNGSTSGQSHDGLMGAGNGNGNEVVDYVGDEGLANILKELF